MPPNDFLPRLESLIERAWSHPNPLKRFAAGQERDALLANHAPALAQVVRAAQEHVCWNTVGITGENVPCSMCDALAALNKEAKP